MFCNTASAMTARDIMFCCRIDVCQEEHTPLANLPSENSRVLLQLIVFDFFFFNPITLKAMNTSQSLIANETPLSIPKGFLENSEETLCMLPFKEHPKVLTVYE